MLGHLQGRGREVVRGAVELLDGAAVSAADLVLQTILRVVFADQRMNWI
jgi:hypothetical protein